MDKDESYKNVEEAQLSHNQDLDYQKQEEENSNHVMEVIRATSIDFLGKCIDESKNLDLLMLYAEEQKMIERFNHYACLRKAQQRMKIKREQKDD